MMDQENVIEIIRFQNEEDVILVSEFIFTMIQQGKIKGKIDFINPKVKSEIQVKER